MKKVTVILATACLLIVSNFVYADETPVTQHVAEALNIANPSEGAKGLRKRYIHKHYHRVKQEKKQEGDQQDERSVS